MHNFKQFLFVAFALCCVALVDRGFAQDLTVSSAVTISSNATYTNVTVTSTGVLTLDAVLNVTNNMTIESGGRVTHSSRFLAGLVLNISGTLDVQSGGLIDVAGKGLRGGNSGGIFGNNGEAYNAVDSVVSGAGGGNYYSAGASYGGVGGNGSSGHTTNSSYGTLEDPRHLGSGGGGAAGIYAGGAGGGRITITAGNCIINGVVRANGADGVNGPQTGAGSGGAIKITATSISGSGTIQANGGNGQCSSGQCSGAGSGGRIAIFYASATFPSSNIEARGGTGDFAGSAGTIYLKDAAQTHGDVIVNNGGVVSTLATSLLTGLPELRDIAVQNSGLLEVRQAIVLRKLTVTNEATNALSFNPSTASISGEVQRTIAAGSTSEYKFTNTNTTLQSNGTQSAITISVTSFPNTYPPNAPPGTAINRYYSISPSGSLTADVKLEYLQSEINGLDENLFALYRNANGTWYAYSSIVNTTQKWVKAFGISAFSNWTIGQSNNPLPIQLALFTGTFLGNNSLRLNWRTLSEINNYGFFVHRASASDSIWSELPNSFIPGHGTTNEPHDYAFTDNTVTNGSWMYKLKQVDLDGTIHFTEPIIVAGVTAVGEQIERAPLEFALFQNYPNPFNPTTRIRFSVEKTDRAALDVYNILGQHVATLFDDVAKAGQYYRVQFDASKLASGMYMYRLHSGKRSELKKLLHLK